MAVTGLVHPDRLLTKDASRPGDLLMLTKPLGTGIITTALRQKMPVVRTAATNKPSQLPSRPVNAASISARGGIASAMGQP